MPVDLHLDPEALGAVAARCGRLAEDLVLAARAAPGDPELTDLRRVVAAAAGELDAIGVAARTAAVAATNADAVARSDLERSGTARAWSHQCAGWQ